MSNYWTIKEVGNGYVVEYPYLVKQQNPSTTKYGTLFTATFEAALKLCEDNSMLPTPEDALKSR